MTRRECPIDAAEEALRLASQVEVHDIPLDFDPGDLRWREILAVIARQFSSHGALLGELDDLLAQARGKLNEDCDCIADESAEGPCRDCTERWLAEHRLWEAALDASERAYQRWLARDALRRAAEGDA